MEKPTCRVIYNPVTTGFIQVMLDIACKEFESKYEVEACKSEYPGHAVELAKKSNEDADLTVSYGGDGTFGELIKGIYDEEQKTVLGHIPIGTANDLRRNFGLQRNPVVNAGLIRDGVVRDFDIFTINGIPFSYVGAFGYLANVPCNTPSELKKKHGYLAYLMKAWEEYKNVDPKIYNIDLFDGKNESQVNAMVGAFSNSCGFGGMKLFKDADISDGMFEATFVKQIPKAKILKLASQALTGRLDYSKYPEYFEHFSTDHLDMKFNNGEPEGFIDLDGDPAYVSNNDDVYSLRLGKTLKIQVPKR